MNILFLISSNVSAVFAPTAGFTFVTANDDFIRFTMFMLFVELISST